MSRLRRRKRAAISLPEITLTPLIDTALTLLIIFMVATPIVSEMQEAAPGVLETDLAKGNDGQAPNYFVITLADDTGIYINDKDYSKEPWESLVATIDSYMNRSSDKKVFITANQYKNYGEVLKFVQRIKEVESVKTVALSATKSSS